MNEPVPSFIEPGAYPVADEALVADVPDNASPLDLLLDPARRQKTDRSGQGAAAAARPLCCTRR